MKRFKVKAKFTARHTIAVQAVDGDAARAAARENIEGPKKDEVYDQACMASRKAKALHKANN